tara:strand:+ start:1486 stop:2295 length:810 start_codon:yes stop_codon:yes gene_type:complete
MATRKTRKIKRKSGSKSKNYAVKKIQSVYRKKQTRKKSKAATKIQSHHRKKQTKKNRSKAATKLQKIIRGNISRKECSICQMPGARFKTKCNHFFHKKCLKKWCKKKSDCTCPLCRKKLDKEELNNLSASFASSESTLSPNLLMIDQNRSLLEEIMEDLVLLQSHALVVVSTLEDNFLVDTSERYEHARENAEGLENYTENAINMTEPFPPEFREKISDLDDYLRTIEHPLDITDENFIKNQYRNIASRAQEILDEADYLYENIDTIRF